LGTMGRGYMAIRFSTSDGIHYGWLQLSIPDEIIPFPAVVDWAYESVPGTQLAAGVVPQVAAKASWTESNTVFLAWGSDIGAVYQAQQRTNLSQGRWQNFGDSVAATAANSAIIISIDSQASFFRVVRVRP